MDAYSSPSQDSERVEYQILHGGIELQTPQSAGAQSAGPAKYRTLSRHLHESLPSLEDSDMINKARGDMSTLFHQMLTVPYYDLDRNGSKSLESLLKRPGPEAHPALIARHMLHVATFLQHLHPDFHSDLKQLIRAAARDDAATSRHSYQFRHDQRRPGRQHRRSGVRYPGEPLSE